MFKHNFHSLDKNPPNRALVLLDAFKEMLHKENLSPRSNDLINAIDKLLKDRPDEVNTLSFQRSLSALIAAASMMVQSMNSNISSFELDIPSFVMDDLDILLSPYLNALQIDGYQKRRKRKAFVVGNTGR